MSKKQIVHFISSLAYGGAEQVLVSLIDGLGSEEYTHRVLFIHDGPHRQTLEKKGIHCQPIRGLFCSYDPIFFFLLFKILKEYKPDLLHTSLWAANWCGRLAAWILKIPVIHAYHNCAQLDGRVRNMLDRLTAAQKVPAIAASYGAAQSLALKGIDPNRVQVIVNGIIFSSPGLSAVLRDALLLRMSGIEPFTIGMVARFDPVKNHITVLKALALLQKKYAFKALLVGAGNTNLIETWCTELGIKECVTIINDQPSAEFLPFFDCFILPSLSEGGISLALQEAMHYGLPCIISHAANVQNIIEHEKNGLVVSATDENELAHVIERIIENKEWGTFLGSNARHTIEQCGSYERMISHYKMAFERAFIMQKK